ncbi:hypothetical protein ACN6LI_008365 [Streptomyces violaceoruber]
MVRENLAETARELGESVRDVRGYEYAVIHDHALFPFRYADKPKPLDRARLPANVSPTRRRLFRAHGPQGPDALFDVDGTVATEEYLGLQEAFEELGASTRLVCVFFTADAENGIHAIHWGEAHLEPDRTFTWLYKEQLPVAPVPLEWRGTVATGQLQSVGLGDWGRLWAVQGRPTPTDNDRSPRHLNWSEPWASSGPLVSGAGDQ